MIQDICVGLADTAPDLCQASSHPGQQPGARQGTLGHGKGHSMPTFGHLSSFPEPCVFGQLELIIEEKRETELPLANSTVRFVSREGKTEKDPSTGDSPAESGGRMGRRASKQSSCQQLRKVSNSYCATPKFSHK